MAKYETLSDLTDQDILDSRDLEEIITELEEEQEEATGGDVHDPAYDGTTGAEILDALRELRAAIEGVRWEYGIGFIRDSYFTEYAEEIAYEIGAIDSSASWPLSCIDWERAADELKMDYSSIDIGGVSFWYRGA